MKFLDFLQRFWKLILLTLAILVIARLIYLRSKTGKWFGGFVFTDLGGAISKG